MATILVVEDNEEIRENIVEILEFNGYKCIEAQNGAVGLDRARNFKPDIIISDIMMPVMDGIEMLQALRRDDRLSTIPIIFITAKNTIVDIRTGMSLGADDYLIKPFSQKDVLRSVAVQLQKLKQRIKANDFEIERLRSTVIRALPHELLTPLTSIMGNADVLEMLAESISSHDIRRSATHIQQSAARLHKTVLDFLTIAKIELAKKDFSSAENMRRGVVISAQDVIEQIAHSIAEHHHRLDDLQLSLKGGSIFCAHEYFVAAVEKILDNAFRYLLREDVVSVATRVEDNQFILQVSDQGKGMSEYEIHHISPFVQFGRNSGEQQGLGLGLVIAQGIMNIIGGQFAIESTVGRGTTVLLFFPLSNV